MADRAHHTAQAQAAAVFAGAARIRNEAVALDPQRVFHFDRFHRQIRRVGDVHLHAILAVLGEAPAEAAAERFEVDVIAAVARIVPEEDRGGVRAIRGADRRLRDRGRERTDHHVDDALRRVGARRDCCRKLRVEQRAERRRDVDQIN